MLAFTNATATKIIKLKKSIHPKPPCIGNNSVRRW